MEVSIITSPNSELNIKKEIQLAKVGLLYSDKVTILSPTLMMLLSIFKMAGLSEKERFEFLKEVIPAMQPNFTPEILDQAFTQYRFLKNKKGKNREEMTQFMRIKSMLTKFDRDINKIVEKLFMESGLIEGINLIEDGTLSLNIFDFGKDSNDFTQGILDETIKLITDVDSYPIFDELIENLADSWIKENSLNCNSINASELKFSKELLVQLPNLDGISFETLINLKESLNLPLEKFRYLIYNFSKGTKWNALF